MASLPLHYLTPDEYLVIERSAESKSEYIDGAMFAMAGGTERHNAIVANLIISIGIQLKGRDCRVYPSHLKVRVPSSTRFFYPDVSVVCGDPLFADDHKDVILNPVLIIEVSSESTAGFDRGRKFLSYQQIEPLKEFVIVQQDDILVERFVRQLGDDWLYKKAAGLDASVTFDSINCKVHLNDIYSR